MYMYLYMLMPSKVREQASLGQSTLAQARLATHIHTPCDTHVLCVPLLPLHLPLFVTPTHSYTLTLTLALTVSLTVSRYYRGAGSIEL